jgi:hypothetical protein
MAIISLTPITSSAQNSLEDSWIDLPNLGNSLELDHRVRVWKILQRELPSLMSTEPTEGTTPHVWMLNREAANFESDRARLLSMLPHHRVFGTGPVFYER